MNFMREPTLLRGLFPLLFAGWAAFLPVGKLVAADSVAPSALPPAALMPSQVLQFVGIGFDDNGYSGLEGSGGNGAMTWSTSLFRELRNPAGSGNPATFDGFPVRVSYFVTSHYIAVRGSESPEYVKQSWRRAYDDGHEIGNHTQSHRDGREFGEAEWLDEIDQCNAWLIKPYAVSTIPEFPDPGSGIGLAKAEIQGFRAPFLNYNDALMAALVKLGFLYDVSIEDGFQPEVSGRSFLWPYTLDKGSPGNDYRLTRRDTSAVGAHPGLWELPAYPVIVPPDDALARYGLKQSLRDKVKSRVPRFDVSDGKLTGLDYAMWVQAQMTRDEFLATLKYTLDERLAGNRAPFLFGAHTDYYSPKYDVPTQATVAERREAMEAFVQYALSKPEVRMRPFRDLIGWMRQPVALNANPLPFFQVTARGQGEWVEQPICSLSDWQSAAGYPGGVSVSHEGRTWRARWWTRKVVPGSDPVWEDLGPCTSGVLTERGQVTPPKQWVEKGSRHTVTIIPDPGYRVRILVVDGQEYPGATSFTFDAVTRGHQLDAIFEPEWLTDVGVLPPVEQ